MIKYSLTYILLLVSTLSAYNHQHEGLFEKLFNAGRYELISHIIEKDDVLLEAGAFDGSDTVGLSGLVPQGKVISFEPNPPRYEEILERTATLSNVSAWPYALGEENGIITFYVCHGYQNDPVYEGASSVLPPSKSMEENYQGPRIDVRCYVLDDWCKEFEVSKIDFMWLDLEGNELQVLRSSPNILSTVKAIYVETNFYEFRKGMTQYGELRKFLVDSGFKLLSHGYDVGYQGNAIFVRADLFDGIVSKLSAIEN